MSNNDSQRFRIEELKRRIREATGEQPVFGTMNDCPPEVEEAFLQQVLEFESAAETSLFAALKGAGVHLPNPDELDDAQVNVKLWEVIRALAELGVFIHNTDHLSDRELYAFLWCDALADRVKLMPDNSYHIDATETSDEDSLQVYLKYYADDEERLLYATDFPEIQLPAHCDPPYDRDRLMPDG